MLQKKDVCFSPGYGVVPVRAKVYAVHECVPHDGGRGHDHVEQQQQDGDDAHEGVQRAAALPDLDERHRSRRSAARSRDW